MVSLAQVGIYGIAGMAYANLVLADGGAARGLEPVRRARRPRWSSRRVVGLGFGWIAARSEGIYFLMITLAFSVLVFYFFSQVTGLSGFGGINSVDLPSVVGNPGERPGAALLRDAVRRGARVPRPRRAVAHRVRARRCRACATSRRACARSAST